MTATTTEKDGSGMARIAVVVAVILVAIPAWAWTRESARFYTMDLGFAFLGIYLPARLLALLGLVFMFFQFVLAARIPAVERLFKRGKLLKIHRSLGKWAYLMVLLHGVGMLAFDLVSSGEIYLYTETIVGLVALVLLTAAVLAAWFFKPLKLSLNQWRTIHLLTYIVFPLVIWHALMLGSTVNAVPTLRYLLIGLFAGYVVLLLFRLYRKFIVS